MTIEERREDWINILQRAVNDDPEAISLLEESDKRQECAEVFGIALSKNGEWLLTEEHP